jgi:AcrR family transcriptional regulator
MPKTLSDEDIHQFREAMRRIAENAFATRGAQGVTMRELARELGCSAMTPYR